MPMASKKVHRLVGDGHSIACGAELSAQLYAVRFGNYLRAFLLRHDHVEPCLRCWPPVLSGEADRLLDTVQQRAADCHMELTNIGDSVWVARKMVEGQTTITATTHSSLREALVSLGRLDVQDL